MTKLISILILPALLCAQPLSSRAVTIGVELEPFTGPALFNAERIATRMLASAGIRARWINRLAGSSESGCFGDITVRLTSGNPNSEEMGLHMAYALPYSRSGVGIRIRWDKVVATAGRVIGSQSMLLAHVIVHEVTHVLQGIARHSEDGIMRPFWTSRELWKMNREPLKFTPDDITLIHLGWPRKASACPDPRSPGDKGSELVTAGLQVYPLL